LTSETHISNVSSSRYDAFIISGDKKIPRGFPFDGNADECFPQALGMFDLNPFQWLPKFIVISDGRPSFTAGRTFKCPIT
jgi:hypothetical protein